MLDPASFVLPFDYYFVEAIAAKGIAVDFYCSKTIANFELVDRLRQMRHVSVYEYSVSSTVTGRLKGALGYVRMCLAILGRARSYRAVILQYSVLPALELLLFVAIRKKLWLLVHEEGGLAGRDRVPLPFRALKYLARRLLFASPVVMAEHARSDRAAPDRLSLTRHGVSPVTPEDLGIAISPHERTEKVLAFWGLVKPYKGVDLFVRLVDSGMFKEFTLEVHGKWHPSALQAKHELMRRGVLLDDRFLPPAEVRRLLLRPIIFVLPYRSGSQSGVLYTLLNYGCVFVSTDVGDNGHFLREQGLGDLLFDREDLRSAQRAVRFAQKHFSDMQDRLLKIRHEFGWANAANTVARLVGDGGSGTQKQ